MIRVRLKGSWDLGARAISKVTILNFYLRIALLTKSHEPPSTASLETQTSEAPRVRPQSPPAAAVRALPSATAARSLGQCWVDYRLGGIFRKSCSVSLQ